MIPIEKIGSIKDLMATENGDYDQRCGRIYLVEINGFLKIGMSRCLSQRARGHFATARTYCMTVGSGAYSPYLCNITSVECALHRKLIHLRVDGATEMYNGKLSEIISLLDVDCVLATPIDRQAEMMERIARNKIEEAKRERRRELREFRIAFQNKGGTQ